MLEVTIEEQYLGQSSFFTREMKIKIELTKYCILKMIRLKEIRLQVFPLVTRWLSLEVKVRMRVEV